MSSTKGRVLVAMSGGVDSSVAAMLLARDGYEVVGVTMRLFSAPDENTARLNRSCCSIEDVEDARRVCRTIGARHHFMNFERQFRSHVIDHFVGEYERGRTPYPCLACNDRLKFDFLMQRSSLLDAEYIATGHYARIQQRQGSWHLLRGVDASKDQSYVLHTLSQEQLTRLLLPIGDYPKSEVRQLAHSGGLCIADKADSQDICFIPDGDYRSFIEPRMRKKIPGVIASADGTVLVQHDGIHSFTIGQRRGLPLQGGTTRPMYVTAIDPDSGLVTIGPADDLLRDTVTLSSVHWISGVSPTGPHRMQARIRYRARPAFATVTPLANGAFVRFDESQRAVTPGQALVFYDGDEVLGGGTIELPKRPHDRFAEMTQAVSQP